MELRVDVDGDDAELGDLYRWLARDSDLTHRIRISLARAPFRPGEQGGAFEAINAVISDGTALGGLVVAVLSFRHARREKLRGSVRLERNGTVVTIEPGTEVPAEEIVERLTGDGGAAPS